MEAQDIPGGVEIPAAATNHPLTIAGFVVLILLILAAAAKRYASQTVVPAWRWATGRDSRAYAELLEEVELLREQLEESRKERRVADGRHSREIAELRSQYERDMQMLADQLAATQRQLVEVLAGVKATRIAVESADPATN